MAGRANMFGMALGLISDLFPSKEDSNRSDAMWRIQKRMGYGYRPSEQELREEINSNIELKDATGTSISKDDLEVSVKFYSDENKKNEFISKNIKCTFCP